MSNKRAKRLSRSYESGAQIITSGRGVNGEVIREISNSNQIDGFISAFPGGESYVLSFLPDSIATAMELNPNLYCMVAVENPCNGNDTIFSHSNNLANTFSTALNERGLSVSRPIMSFDEFEQRFGNTDYSKILRRRHNSISVFETNSHRRSEFFI